MFTQVRHLMLFAALFAFVAVGCGPKAAPQTSVMDTPEYHYNQGIKAMDANRSDDAMREFDRAIALDPNAPLGYIGKGLVLGKKGDFKAAYENMGKAKDNETKGIESRIGMIRLNGLQLAADQKQVNDLVKSSEREFKAANEK